MLLSISSLVIGAYECVITIRSDKGFKAKVKVKLNLCKYDVDFDDLKIVNFKVLLGLDKIRKRSSSVSYLFYFKSRECISGHTIFISRPIQDIFNFNNHYDKS